MSDFRGAINIVPQLSIAKMLELNEFCGERHDEPGYPNIWCDWRTSQNGTQLIWNGSEKSYSMAEWLSFLIQEFLSENEYQEGYVLNGEVEELWRDGRGKIICEDNIVRTEGYENG